jgi:hypothetical protein
MKKLDISTKKHPNTYSLVDDEDYDYLNQWKWSLNGCGYIRRHFSSNGRRKDLYLHRVIMKSPNGLSIDHINHNLLDNRKSNLRTCCHRENMLNRKKRRFVNKEKNEIPTSKYIGVFRDKVNKGWVSVVTIKRKIVYKRIFDTEIEAAITYNRMARKLLGEFANLNRIDWCA